MENLSTNKYCVLVNRDDSNKLYQQIWAIFFLPSCFSASVYNLKCQ